MHLSQHSVVARAHIERALACAPRQRSQPIWLIAAAAVVSVAPTAVSADSASFVNPTLVDVPDLSPADPYPSTITVKGMSGAITHLRVTLHSLSHTWPGDLDMLLVAPDGRNLVIMSDCGGSLDAVDASLTFDDNAAGDLTGIPVATGSYRPTDVTNPGKDVYPAPAPSPSGATELATFNGSDPNGQWALYVVDDDFHDIGALAGGWELELTTSGGASGCFSATPYPVGAEPSCVVMGDLNGDTFNDLVVANHDLELDNRISVLLNNGDGTFAPSVYYDAGDRPYWIDLGDIDGDLDLDVAVSNFFDTTASVYLNNGDGSLQPQIMYQAGPLPGFVLLERLDGDADLDLAVTNIGNGTVSILMNNGDGTFARQSAYDCGVGPYGLVAADFNADTWPDLAISNHHTDTLSVLMNNGDGTFGAATPYTVHAGPVGNDVADLDHDGDIDIVVANTNQAATGTTISVLMNNGDGTFDTHTPYAAETGPYTIKVVDFNADGFGDIAASHEGGFASIRLNNGDGTFADPANFPIGSDPVGLDVGDLDGNGTPELAATCYGADEVWVLFNQYAGVVSDPIGGSFALGDAIVLSAVGGGPEPLTYRWQRDGIDLEDDARISGAGSDTLTIDPAEFADTGLYTLTVSNDCGRAVSEPADVLVFNDCPADVNFSGAVDVDDLIAIILGWGACTDCNACPADVKATPEAGNCAVDVDDLIAVILGWGACP